MSRKYRQEGSEEKIRRDVAKYCAAHPRSPSAVRRPHIFTDHGRYVALLGKSIKDGVFGFGSSVFSALQAFDNLYLQSQVRNH